MLHARTRIALASICILIMGLSPSLLAQSSPSGLLAEKERLTTDREFLWMSPSSDYDTWFAGSEFSVSSPARLTNGTPEIGKAAHDPEPVEEPDADEDERLETVDLYLDCRRCFSTFIRQEVDFVNYVRDQEDADIHLRINSESTGGGREYTLRYHGQSFFDGRENVLRFHSSDNDTRDERRRGLVRQLKLGLMPYMMDTELADRVDISVRSPEEDGGGSNPQQQDDPWNNWVFEIGAGASFSGDDNRQSIDLDGEIEADRITRDWKIRLSVEGNYDYNWFSLPDGGTTTTEVRDQSYSGLFVRSVTEHLSVGMYTGAESSTFDNYDLRMEAAPAVEYNLFPYSEYGERELRFMYRVSPTYTDYIEETIYQQTSETLYNQQVSLDLDLNRRWGRIRSSVSASHYLHDFDLNRIEFFSSLNLRLYRGLSLRLRGSYDIISDQVAIPAQDVTDEEALLDIRQQATDFSYWGSVGLSYQFGSMYDNIVNPRF